MRICRRALCAQLLRSLYSLGIQTYPLLFRAFRTLFFFLRKNRGAVYSMPVLDLPRVTRRQVLLYKLTNSLRIHLSNARG